MAFTYDVSLLTQSGAIGALMQVRLLIGDTQSNDVKLQDEEITFLITTRPTIYGAAAECCRSIATNLARKADTSQGEMKNNFSQLTKNYQQMAALYENKAALSGFPVPYAGGTSVTDMNSAQIDGDRVAPQFSVGMTDNYLPIASEGNAEGTPTSDPVSESL
jgi:hypothetical protein